jgi:hypothetical protein
MVGADRLDRRAAARCLRYNQAKYNALIGPPGRLVMRFFLAGIMQGSHLAAVLHDQHYRSDVGELVARYFPDAEIYDPLADHANSLDYDETRGRDVFLRHNRLCGEVDVVIAFVPQASMGTAIEMWEAHRHGRVVLTISPLAHNWAVRFLSDAVYPDLEAFEAALASGEAARAIARARNDPARADRSGRYH